jgi:hypothetical protein
MDFDQSQLSTTGGEKKKNKAKAKKGKPIPRKYILYRGRNGRGGIKKKAKLGI